MGSEISGVYDLNCELIGKCEERLECKVTGRPSKYAEAMNEQVYKLCLLGAIDKEIADFFGVCERTLNYWKTEFEGFRQAIWNGKMMADAKVAERLHQRANGYEYYEETEELAPSEHNPEIFYVKYKKRVKKEMPPDTGACMAWLKNRRPSSWRETKAVEINMDPKLEDFL